MDKKRPIKRAVTLIEMIVVMILIATITGAVAYNYRESLNRGREFRTKEGMERIRTIISLYFAEHPEEIQNSGDGQALAEKIISDSPLVTNAKEFLKDGWGYKYKIDLKNTGSDIDVQVNSQGLDNYKNKSK